jgi:hypothetical protein
MAQGVRGWTEGGWIEHAEVRLTGVQCARTKQASGALHALMHAFKFQQSMDDTQLATREICRANHVHMRVRVKRLFLAYASGPLDSLYTSTSRALASTWPGHIALEQCHAVSKHIASAVNTFEHCNMHACPPRKSRQGNSAGVPSPPKAEMVDTSEMAFSVEGGHCHALRDARFARKCTSDLLLINDIEALNDTAHFPRTVIHAASTITETQPQHQPFLSAIGQALGAAESVAPRPLTDSAIEVRTRWLRLVGGP